MAVDGAAQEKPADAPADVVITKLAPVAQQATLLKREWLTNVLDAAHLSRLILITAPAGYGKTTLLGQWRECLLSRSCRTAWLSLDDEDGDASELLTYLCHSLVRAGLQFDADLRTLAMSDDVVTKQYLRRLLNTLAEDGQATFLILDEVDHLPLKTMETVIVPLLRWAPQNLTIIIASRSTPALPLSTLRVQGLVTELKANDLRFTQAEINTLFKGSLSRQDVATIAHHTEGWPVALQLLRSCWSRDHDRHHLLDAYTGLSAEIGGYLSEQIFARLPEAVHQLLVESSILDRLSAGTIERVIGPTAAWAYLLQSDLMKPFLVAVDKDVGAYRLHRVLREELQRHFALLPKDRRDHLYRAAAQWHAHAHHLSRAVRYALLADDIDMAGKVIEDAGGIQIWIRYGFNRVKDIDALLTPKLLERFPRLQLLRALVLTKDGSTASARRLFENVRIATQDFTVTGDGSPPDALRLDSMVTHSTLLFNECRAASDDYIQNYETTIRRISGDDHVFLANVNAMLCLTYHQRGLFERAITAAHDAIDYSRQAGLPHAEFFEHLHIGAINYAQGQREAAENAYTRAHTIARKHFPDDGTKGVLLGVLNADLAYECNQIGLAERRLRSVENQLTNTEAWFDIYATAYGMAAMLALNTQGIDLALTRIDDAWRMANERQLVGLKPFLSATRISCLTFAGLIPEAAAVAQDAGLSLDHIADHNDGQWRENEAIVAALSRLAIAQGHAIRIAHILPPLVQKLRSKGHVRSTIRLGLLAAIALNNTRDFVSADAQLQMVLGLSARSGYQQAFHQEGASVVALLKRFVRAMDDSLDSSVRNHAINLLSSLDVGPRAKGNFVTLSPREIQVLRELSTGHSDKTIARALELTENTVKYHLKNIYGKLRVGNRTEAVASARKRSLL